MKYAIFKDTITELYATPTTCREDGRGGIEDEALYGHKCRILEEAGVWLKVETAYRYRGWVERSTLFEIDEERYMSREADESLRFVASSFADVVAIPKVQGRILATLTRGGIISVTGEVEDGWQPVVTATGEPGFVKASLLMPYYAKPISDDEQTFRREVCARAISYLGTQYRWGGKSPLGIDCSGLCSMAYMLSGVYIYRDASIVEGFPVHRITLEEAKPGDLLFFPGHIAMYLGDGKFIHSTAHVGSDGVVFNSIREGDDGYRGDLLASMTEVGSIFGGAQ